MRHVTFLVLLLSILNGEIKYWSSHSAHISPPKRWEIGLFQPFRYGYSENFEYTTYPLWFFVMPNVAFKKKHDNIFGYNIASKWGMIYPTPILNMVARKDIGGFIDPTFQIPPLLGLSTSLIMTKQKLSADLTFNAGIDLGITLGNLDERSTIELPLVYHRLAIFYNHWALHAGLDFEKKLTNQFHILMDFDIKILPGMGIKDTGTNIETLIGEYSLEHKLLFIFAKSEKFRFLTGYKFVYGEYPFGTESRLLPFVPLLDKWIPIIELQWARSRK